MRRSPGVPAFLEIFLVLSVAADLTPRTSPAYIDCFRFA
jgi:hypothetical protein